MRQPDPLRTFSEWKAAALGDAVDACLSNAERITWKIHGNSARDSAQQVKRVPVDSDGGTTGSISFIHKMLQQCADCRVFDKAPHLPISSAPAA